MRSFSIPRWERIRRLVVPAALPQIAAGMRTSPSLAVIIMVVAEYFSSTNGVGYVLLRPIKRDEATAPPEQEAAPIGEHLDG